jgi:hypothetical protein
LTVNPRAAGIKPNNNIANAKAIRMFFKL